MLRWLIKAVQEDADLELQLVVTGTHLSYEYGYSIQRIQEDGFPITETVEVSLSSNTREGMVKSAGLAMISFAEVFKRLSPDIVVLLGDRFEIFAVAVTANLMQLPIAHIHGGELTLGAVDDAFRHSITKMSHIHFPISDVYARRIAQMGEDQRYIYNYGAPGLDCMDKQNFYDQKSLEKKLKIKFLDLSFLITYHPVTKSEKNDENNILILLHALEHFESSTLIFTEANIDAGGQAINKEIRNFVKLNSNRAYLFKEVGLPDYLSLMKIATVLIGNSSSGIIEAPCIGTPTVNIGSRQAGRLRSQSVIDVVLNEIEIINAINKAIAPEFRLKASRTVVPFKQKDTSLRIKNTLKTIDLTNITKKTFIDYEANLYHC